MMIIMNEQQYKLNVGIKKLLYVLNFSYKNQSIYILLRIYISKLLNLKLIQL